MVQLGQVLIPNTEKAFTYDYALPGDASNETTYNQAVAGMIPRLFEVTLSCFSLVIDTDELPRATISLCWPTVRRAPARPTVWAPPTRKTPNQS